METTYRFNLSLVNVYCTRQQVPQEAMEEMVMTVIQTATTTEETETNTFVMPYGDELQD